MIEEKLYNAFSKDYEVEESRNVLAPLFEQPGR